MLVRRSGRSARISFIEDPLRQLPQHRSREADHHAVTAALDRPAAQSGENADGPQPGDHVVANRNDWRRTGLSRCPLDGKQAR